MVLRLLKVKLILINMEFDSDKGESEKDERGVSGDRDLK